MNSTVRTVPVTVQYHEQRSDSLQLNITCYRQGPGGGGGGVGGEGGEPSGIKTIKPHMNHLDLSISSQTKTVNKCFGMIIFDSFSIINFEKDSLPRTDRLTVTEAHPL